MAEEWNLAGDPLPDIKLVRFNLRDFDRIRFTIHSTASYRALICLLLVAILVFTMSWTFTASISQAETRLDDDVLLAFPTVLFVLGIVMVIIAVISATLNQEIVINREARVISFVSLVLGIPIRKKNVPFDGVVQIKQLPFVPFSVRRLEKIPIQNFIGFVLGNGQEMPIANSFSLENDDQEKLMYFLNDTIILDK
ncbi:MAG TPA: hypothetical protein VKM55_06870 [Candidatus Lokiarchaeia archaeon]|nr:hypothetical protein [Candidatus Lokiarchaeia archaeon]